MKFLDTSESEVKRQIWCTVPNDLLIAIVKIAVHTEASLDILLRFLSMSIFEKVQLYAPCNLMPDHQKHHPTPIN